MWKRIPCEHVARASTQSARRAAEAQAETAANDHRKQVMLLEESAASQSKAAEIMVRNLLHTLLPSYLDCPFHRHDLFLNAPAALRKTAPIPRCSNSSWRALMRRWPRWRRNSSRPTR
jgi:hypothetical protein